MAVNENKNTQPDEPDEKKTILALGLHPVEDDVVVKSIVRNEKNDLPAAAPEPVSKAGENTVLQKQVANAGMNDREPGRWVGFVTISLMLLWIATAGLISYEFLDLENIASYNVWQFTGVTMFFIVPLIAIMLMGYGFKRLVDVAAQTTRLAAAAKELTQIDEHITGRTTEMARNIIGEIQRIEHSLDHTNTRLSSLGDMLNSEIQKLDDTGDALEQKAESIKTKLAAERAALNTVSVGFENGITMLSDSLQTHSASLDSYARQAQKSLEESQLVFTTAAIKINSAADILKASSHDAASTLSEKHVEIIQLSQDMKSQIEAVGTSYSKHLKDAGRLMTQLNLAYEKLSEEAQERFDAASDLISSQNSQEIQLVQGMLADDSKPDASDDASEPAKAENSEAASRSKLHLHSIEPDDVEANIVSAKETAKQSQAQLVDQLRPAPDEAAQQRYDTDPFDSSQMDIVIPTADDVYRQGLKPPATQVLVDDDMILQPNLPFEGAEPLEPTRVSRYDNQPPQKSWWRNILGLGPARSSDYAIDQLVGHSADVSVENESQPPLFDADILEMPNASTLVDELTELGFAPSAIVDDGTIDNAIAIRLDQGAIAMSAHISRRLGDPVGYLRENLAKDKKLRVDVLNFTSEFHRSLSQLGNNTDALRKRLQSDAGRAFLLCDAAVNT